MLSLFFFYGGGAILVLRCVLGAIFIVHGWAKIKDLKQNATNFNAMGFKPGSLFGTLAALLEFFGGIALILGLFISGFAALYIAEFAVILIWKLSKGMPFVGGWEFDLLILASVILLFILGGGAYSLDRLWLGGF